ncbi:39S ribosomal protein L18, mitochondrial [Atta colombica]|uniref:Large ribosomal subunit protein uL18m n=1 Tax=Atta colombica TaxID=520822 RepID=A0A195BRC1_9HYME|nr:PREDICTED: 39S ribosomal protein L18, mitochondrial [Atta colombica]XP_018060294.1 PREDICTED: 39S ribosomal protein L18, mitochondrial [Atta colombica]KYM88506.1 39S ribosomal protein L18, mitochondrial [Atta colombica]
MYSVNVRAGITRMFRMHRELHGNAELIKACTEIVNRNPRNLERLRIARKPQGYHLEKSGCMYWHKLFLIKKSRYIIAEVCHFKNGPVVSASSAEWALKKQLYRTTDSSAYINIGRVLAQRCLEAGICEMEVDAALTGDKCELLIKELEKNNIVLTESQVYKYPNSWDSFRPEKPWEIHE